MCRRGRFYSEENGRVFRYVLAEVCWQEETRGRLTRSGNYFEEYIWLFQVSSNLEMGKLSVIE